MSKFYKVIDFIDKYGYGIAFLILIILIFVCLFYKPRQPKMTHEKGTTTTIEMVTDTTGHQYRVFHYKDAIAVEHDYDCTKCAQCGEDYNVDFD